MRFQGSSWLLRTVRALCRQMLQEWEAKQKENAEMIREKTGLQTTLITNVGPVIGAHAGPGAIAVAFFKKQVS